MKNIFFIYPNPNRRNPRGIRVTNILAELHNIAPENKYQLLSFSDSIWRKKNKFLKVNLFNFIYLILRYCGFFKYGKLFFRKAKILDPYLFVHFIIKFDLRIRLKKLNAEECIFIVVVSPFSNFLLIPWLKQKYPLAKIVCDIGDPLYNNSARWNDDEYSKNIELNSIRKSNSLIVTNESTKEHYNKVFNFQKSNIFIIEQGVDVKLIEKTKNKNNFIKNNLAYAGRFYDKLRSPEELFKFISSQDKYVLNIYGNNNSRNMENINFLGSFSQNELFEKLNQNEILVFIENKEGMQTSGKIFELLAFKKFILFIKSPEISVTYKFAKSYCNVVFAENNSESIKEALLQYEEKRSNLFEYDINSFSWANRAKKYLKVLQIESN